MSTTAEEISSIMESSELTSEEKSELLASYDHEDHHNLQEINKYTISTSSRVVLEHQGKAKQSIDHSLTPEEISSLLNSGVLTSSEKSTLLASNCNHDQDHTSHSKLVNTSNTLSSTVGVKGKIQHTDHKEQAKPDDHKFSKVGASEKSNNKYSSSSPSPQQQLIQVDVIPPSKDGMSSTLSRIDLEEIKSDTEMMINAKGKYASSSFHTQVKPVNDDLLEMKGQEIFIVRVKESGSNVEGKEDEKIHEKDAVCKHCFKYLYNETYVFKAKCRCKLSLIHKHCKVIWSSEKGDKCSACEQVIDNIEVVLSRPPPSSPPQRSRVKGDKQNSTSTRFWSYFCIL